MSPIDGATPSNWRYVVAAFLALAGSLLAGAAGGLLLLAVDRLYAVGWQIAFGVLAAAGLLLVFVAVWLARLAPRRALMTFLGAMLLIPPIAQAVRTNVAGATVYAPAKRTTSELRNLGVALEARAVDERGYPAATSLDALAPLLEGRYIQRVPRVDGWNRALRYETEGGGTEGRYYIGSAGSDGRWQHPRLADYRDRPGPHGDDIVYSNGGFVTLAGSR